jgi:hypothetical protein
MPDGLVFLLQAQEQLQRARVSAAVAAQMSLESDRAALFEQARNYEQAAQRSLSQAGLPSPTTPYGATRRRTRELIEDIRKLQESIRAELATLQARLKRR